MRLARQTLVHARKLLQGIVHHLTHHPAAAGRQGRRFDLVFLDPPYRQAWLDRLWSVLPAMLDRGARLYVEAEAAIVPPAPWRAVRQGCAGQVFYHLLEHE